MKKKILFLLPIVFVMGVNIYLRSFPVNFPQLKAQAKEIVDKTIQQFAINEVQQKFPQFYPLAKDEIVKSKAAEYKRQDKKEIKKQIRDIYLKLKDKYQDETAQTYMMELDCWHWARYVDNVVRLGHPGDEVIYGKQWDMLMLAPMGSFMHWEEFLYYLSASLYKIFAIVKPVSLFTFLFYLPLFFAAVFIVILYLFVFRFAGHIGAVVSCLFVGLAPIFLQRSCAGWFDTDILNLLFPLLVTWTYVLSCESRSLRHRLLWLGFSSFWVGLFSFTWTHWWFIFLIIAVYEGIVLAFETFRYFYFGKDDFSLPARHIVSLSAFLSFSLFWVLLLSGGQPLSVLYNQVRLAFSLNLPLMPTIWPNVLSTVGELRQMSLRDIIQSTGGVWLFWPSVFCMVLLAFRASAARKYTPFKGNAIGVITVWFIAMLFASTRGVRFVVFLLIPLGISLGCAINELYEYLRGINNKKAVFSVLAVLVILCSISVSKGHNAAKAIYPLIDDTWYKLLNIIKEKTPEGTTINSWWDFGDWFKVVAKRRVIFDGQSQEVPQAYWMAKAMLSDNEDEAIGILRMLNNGGNKAFEIVNEHLNEPLQSVLLLEYVIPLAPEKAKEVLLKFLPEKTTQNVMEILFYRPAISIFVVDYTMLGKIGAISYLGNWNFPKVYIAQNFDKEEKDKIIGYLKSVGKDERLMNTFYQEVFLISTKKLDEWLSMRLQFYSPVFNSRQEGDNVIFDNGFIYNSKEKTIKSNFGQIPRSIFVAAQDGSLSEIALSNANSLFSMFIFKNDKDYKGILLDPELGRSIFARLYFLNGKGLKHFLPFIDVETDNNNYIRAFSLAW